MPEPRQFAAVNPQISLTALHDRMIVFAQDVHGQLIHIDAAQRGKACNCRCLACGEALIARHGDIKAHSFAHESGTECQFAVDAMLNRLAQELIMDARVFISPALTVQAGCTGPYSVIRQEETITACRLRVDSAALETRAHPQRPSVVMTVAGRELLLEITYGHRLDAYKHEAICKLGMPAIEMHTKEGMFSTVAQFAHRLLHEAEHKHWIFNPKANAIQARLDAALAGQLAEQNARREEQNARLAREREAAAREEILRQDALNTARAERLRAQEEAAREAAATRRAARPVHLPALHYRLHDGGILLKHQTDGGLLLVPETGSEAVLQAFGQLGLAFIPELGGYLATVDQMTAIVLALRPFQVAVTSV